MKKYQYLVEASIFLAVILLLGYYNSDIAFIGMTAHPFYLVTLLICIRYSYIKGMIATLMAAAVYIVFYLQETTLLMSFDSVFDAAQRPLMFIAFSMFVGLLVEVDKRKISVLNNQVSKFKEMIKDNKKVVAQLRTVNKNLSNQLATVDQSFNVIFYNTKVFFTGDINTIYEVVYELMVKTVKAQVSYIYEFRNDQFNVIYPKGEENRAGDILESNFDAVQRIRIGYEFVRLDKNSLITGTTPVFMGPVFHEDSKHLYGMLVVAEIDFIDYNESTFITFKNLCKWLGTMLHYRENQSAATPAEERKLKEFPYIVPYGATRIAIHKKITESLGHSIGE